MKPVSGKRLAILAEELGWTLARIKGSHHVYTRPDRNAIVVIPIHGNRDLKPGTQRNIMRTLGLSDGDL